MIYADSNVLIRLLEGDDQSRYTIEARLLPLRGSGRFLTTSLLSRLECRVKPLRTNDTLLLSLYDALFSGIEVEIIPLSDAVVEMAALLRAKQNLKTADALHLSSAIVTGATSFLTGDKNLARCTEIPVEIL